MTISWTNTWYTWRGYWDGSKWTWPGSYSTMPTYSGSVTGTPGQVGMTPGWYTAAAWDGTRWVNNTSPSSVLITDVPKATITTSPSSVSLNQSATFSWVASKDSFPSGTTFHYGADGGPYTYTSGQSLSITPTTLGITTGGTHTFWVQGCTSATCGFWASVNFTTTVSVAPTSVSVSASPNPVAINNANFTASWIQSGGTPTDSISYIVKLNGVSLNVAGATSWTGSLSSLGIGLTAGVSYPLTVQACNNSNGCAISPAVNLVITAAAVPFSADTKALPAGGGNVKFTWTPPAGTTNCTLTNSTTNTQVGTYPVTTTSKSVQVTTNATFMISCQ